MKKLKRIFSVLTAAATLLTSAVTVSAETTETERKYDISLVEEIAGKKIIFEEGNITVFEDGEIQDISYDYLYMNYIVPIGDETITPDILGLSAEYKFFNNSFADKYDGMKTYSVRVQTREELDKLYEDSAKLLEDGVIANAYKEVGYSYCCTNNDGGGNMIITVWDDSIDYDVSAMEELEGFDVVRDEEEPEKYVVAYADIFEYIKLRDVSEAIESNENIKRLQFKNESGGMLFCAVAHMPYKRTYLIEDFETEETTEPLSEPATELTVNTSVTTETSQYVPPVTSVTEITDPTEQPTEAVTTTPMETTTADNKVDISLIENITGEEVIYTDGNYICLSGGEGQRVIGCYYRMAYMIERTDSIITPEYFGLSDDYEFVANFPTSDDEEFDVYTVAVESQEELDRLYEESAELLEKGIIKNAYKQYEYEYVCSPYGSSYAYYVLKDENAEFDLNAIEGLEDFEVVQSENDPKKYIIEYTDAFEYIKLKEATDIIEANENIEEYSILCISCSALHVAMKKDEYLIEESETEETTDPTEQPTESVTTTPSEVQEGTEEVIFDANGDQKFNIRDCSYIAMMLAAGKEDELPETADYNKDGKVNVRDAAGMAKYLASTVKKPIPNPNSSL